MVVKDARWEAKRLRAWLEFIAWEGNSSHIESEWAATALGGDIPLPPPIPTAPSIQT